MAGSPLLWQVPCITFVISGRFSLTNSTMVGSSLRTCLIKIVTFGRLSDSISLFIEFQQWWTKHQHNQRKVFYFVNKINDGPTKIKHDLEKINCFKNQKCQ